MRHSRVPRSFALHAGATLTLLATAAACRNAPGETIATTHVVAGATIATAGAPAADSAALARVADSLRADSVRADSARRAVADSVRADSVRAAAGAAGAADSAPKAAARRAYADSAAWAALRPAPLAGSIFPAHRIVAYYGNPLSKRMGILGQIPPAEMMARLEKEAAAWQAADSTVTVKPALHLIATVAQGKPGRESLYRLRMTDSLIEMVAGWAEQKGWLLFLDIQPGHSTIQKELPPLLKYLERPNVHLALDPEFAMTGRGDGALPGKKIGTMSAAEINWAIDTVAKLVTAHRLPPKVLVVHRFTERMITSAARIKRDPRVQVVIDMDGFGPPSLKKSTWRYVIQREPVQYTGVKLFYNPKNDKPLMKPREVIEGFKPAPHYIQYQ